MCMELSGFVSRYVELGRGRSRHVELGIVVSFVSIADNRLAQTCPLSTYPDWTFTGVLFIAILTREIFKALSFLSQLLLNYTCRYRP